MLQKDYPKRIFLNSVKQSNINKLEDLLLEQLEYILNSDELLIDLSNINITHAINQVAGTKIIKEYYTVLNKYDCIAKYDSNGNPKHINIEARIETIYGELYQFLTGTYLKRLVDNLRFKFQDPTNQSCIVIDNLENKITMHFDLNFNVTVDQENNTATLTTSYGSSHIMVHTISLNRLQECL